MKTYYRVKNNLLKESGGWIIYLSEVIYEDEFNIKFNAKSNNVVNKKEGLGVTYFNTEDSAFDFILGYTATKLTRHKEMYENSLKEAKIISSGGGVEIRNS
tara:strand:- start:111 stop:413 length:303 start_codon:yes stop_codon:yes gene_type:complete